jgi:hypothetical protein
MNVLKNIHIYLNHIYYYILRKGLSLLYSLLGGELKFIILSKLPKLQ